MAVVDTAQLSPIADIGAVGIIAVHRTSNPPTDFGSGFDEGFTAGFSAAQSLVGPVVSNIDPTQGTIIGDTEPITFDVTDSDGVTASAIQITLHFLDATSVIAWDGSVFAAGYAGSFTPITGGQAVSINPTDAWEQTISRVVVVASDGLVNSSTTTIGSWLFFADVADPDPGPDPIPVTPTIGTVVAPIDMVAHALDRLVDFLRAPNG